MPCSPFEKHSENIFNAIGEDRLDDPDIKLFLISAVADTSLCFGIHSKTTRRQDLE